MPPNFQQLPRPSWQLEVQNLPWHKRKGPQSKTPKTRAYREISASVVECSKSVHAELPPLFLKFVEIPTSFGGSVYDLSV